MLKINEISLNLDETEDKLPEKIASELKISKQNILSYRVTKRSVDARRKNDIRIKYSVEAKVKGDESLILKRCGNKNVSKASEIIFSFERKTVLSKPPVIIGAGPAGLFASLILAKAGLNPVIIERGRTAAERKKDVIKFFQNGELDPSSNIQFGEGGAGTFSDGKLTTGIKDPYTKLIIDEFIEAGAPEEIRYQAKPHIGTDYLINIVENLREKIKSLGGIFLFESKVTGIQIEKKQILGVILENGREIETEHVILAIGHSARDTFEILYNSGVEMIQKPFSVGARIEHPQELIDKFQYGAFAGHKDLGAADYKLAVHLENGRGVYTFCMCPGGDVVAAASEKGGICVNGMSCFARNGKNANSALLVGVNPEDFSTRHPLAGVEFQREIEKKAFDISGSYHAPAQLLGDFMKGKKSVRFGSVKPTYLPYPVLSDIGECLPEFITTSMRLGILEMDKKMRGFNFYDALLTAPETRSSSPVRILRGENMQSVSVYGLYPCGEGAGYAGGIMSSAVDGIRCAIKLMS